MKKFVLIGMGVVGFTAARVYSKLSDVDQMVLCDITKEKVDAALEGLDSERV